MRLLNASTYLLAALSICNWPAVASNVPPKDTKSAASDEIHESQYGHLSPHHTQAIANTNKNGPDDIIGRIRGVKRRLLRNNGGPTADTTHAIQAEVADISKTYTEWMKTFRQQLKDEDREGILSMIKSSTTNSQYFIDTIKERVPDSEESINFISQFSHYDMESVYDMPTSDLVKSFSPMLDTLDEVIETSDNVNSIFDKYSNDKRRLTSSNSNPKCQPECPFSDEACTCNKLAQCAKDITQYDLAVLMNERYIETESTNNNFADFTVDDNVLKEFYANMWVGSTSNYDDGGKTYKNIVSNWNYIQELADNPSFTKYTLLDGAKYTKCPDGYEVAKADCQAAANALSRDMNIQNRDYLGGGIVGKTPCGCFIWNEVNIDYEECGTGVLSDDGQLVCKNIDYILLDGADFEQCPDGTEVSQADCLAAGNTLSQSQKISDSDRDNLSVGTWDFTPCGCFIWGWGDSEAHIDYKTCGTGVKTTSQAQLVCKRRDTDMGTSVCEKLLEQFVTASPGGSKTPVETHQLTVDEICSAVNTDVKLKSSAILNSLDPTPLATNCFLASYGSCADAIRSFDKLYELYNSKVSGYEPNPMRLTGSTDMEGNEVYTNTRFPTSYIFETDSEGVQTLIYPADNTEIYTYINLEQNADDNPKANCYVDLGDLKSGQDAMETCDESFSLLLGNITSFGTLASIVDNFDEYGLAGSCCLDTAVVDSEHFGFNFDDSKNMTCDKTGPFYLGISRESCENAKGRWTRGPCKELKACVSDYPKKGQPGYSQAFDAYVTRRLSISDASDQKQCNDTRAALGFSQDYPFDNEVCDAFYKLLCEQEASNNTTATSEVVNYNQPVPPDVPKLEPYTQLGALPAHTYLDDSTLIEEVKAFKVATQVLWVSYQSAVLAVRELQILVQLPSAIIANTVAFAILVAWDISTIVLVSMEVNLFNYQNDNNSIFKDLTPWLSETLNAIHGDAYGQRVEMRKDFITLGEWTYYSIIDHTTCLTNYLINGLSASNVTSCEVPLLPQDIFTDPPPAPSNVELVKWTNTSIFDRISSMEKQMSSMEKKLATIAASIGKNVKAKCNKKPDDEVFNRNLLDIDEVDDDDEFDLVVEVVKREVAAVKDEVKKGVTKEEVVTMNEEVKEEVEALKDVVYQLVEQNKELIEQNKELMAKVSASA